MQLLDLPLEVLGEVLRHTVMALGARKALKLRLVNSTFDWKPLLL